MPSADASATLRRMATYQFTGRVHPERASVSLTLPKLEVEVPSLNWRGRVTVFVGVSQIFLTFEGEPVTDLQTLRNTAQNIAQGLANMFCYLYGYAYTVEISGLATDEADYAVFGVDYGAISSEQEQRSLPLLDNRLVRLVVSSKPLARALSDLRSAILDPMDTAFHCQRAIESLRHHFPGTRPDQWQALREALNLRVETLRSFEEAGRAQRHGEVVEMSAADRDEAVLVAWKVTDRFVAYLSGGEQPLATPGFSSL